MYVERSTVSNTHDFRNKVVDTIDRDGHDTHYPYGLAGRLISVTTAYGTPNAPQHRVQVRQRRAQVSMTDAASNATSYAYDSARNGIPVSCDNYGTSRYQYDAFGRQRTTMCPDGTTSINAYDGPGNLVSVTDQAGNQLEYTYGVANQLHTAVQLASPAAGNNTNAHGCDNDGNLIIYTGKERDQESGNDYFGARYYNPAIDRFISEDPIGLAAGTNQYAYVGDAPLSYIDPL
jgi:RHS repeat-associated protein